MERSGTLPATNTPEENGKRGTQHYNTLIEPRHRLFFDFTATPEYEKPILDYLVNQFGWTLEKPFSIRKKATD